MGSMDSYIAEQYNDYKHLCKKHGVEAIGGDQQADHHEWLKLRESGNLTDNIAVINNFELFHMTNEHRRQETICNRLQAELDKRKAICDSLWSKVIKMIIESK